MNKKISLIAAAMCVSLTCTAASAAESDGFKASYDAVSKKVTVMGNGSGEFMETVDLIILSGEHKTEDISENVRPIDYRMVYQDSNGDFEAVIPLSESLKGGKYTVWASVNGVKKYDSIVVVNDEEAKNALDSLNKAVSENEVLTVLKNSPEFFGIDSNASAEELKISAKRIYAGKGNGYGTASEVQKLSSEAAAYAKLANAQSLDEFETIFKYNASVLGASYDEFKDFGTGIKQEFMRQIKAYNYGGESFADIYADLSAVAKVCGADTWNKMKTAVTENAQLFGIDMSSSSEYGRVLNKDRVFEIMFKKKPQSKADIKTKFNESVREAVKEQSSGQPSQPGGGGGGGGSTGGGSTGGGSFAGIQPSEPNTPSVPSDVKSFTDIDGHWAYDDIMSLSKKQVINGFDDSTFRPENKATRAEFVTIIVRAFDLSANSESNTYNDVSSSDWFADTVSGATEIGIVNGDNGNFRPNDQITRQDAAVIIERVLKYLGVARDGEYTFNDSASVSDYAAAAVRNLGAAGIMQGDGGNFRPSDSITRAEIARLIVNCLRYANIG